MGYSYFEGSSSEGIKMKLHLTGYTNEQINLPSTPMGNPIITPILQIRKERSKPSIKYLPKGCSRVSDAVWIWIQTCSSCITHFSSMLKIKLQNPGILPKGQLPSWTAFCHNVHACPYLQSTVMTMRFCDVLNKLLRTQKASESGPPIEKRCSMIEINIW